MTPPPILFDLDGTLIATRRLYIQALARAAAPHLGWEMTEEEIIARRPKAEVRFLREVVGEEAHPSTMKRFFEAYDALHPTHFQGVYRGAWGMLESLRAAGAPLGLVTGKSRQAWEITRRHVELGEFHALVFDDDVAAGKPDPSGLRVALERLGVEGAAPPPGSVYLGDSPTDLDAAVAAGLTPVAVLWSKRAHEIESFARAAEERGGFFVESPEAAVEVLVGGGSR